jgi:hypothetical protein
MKTFRRIGIIAIVVFALAFTACDDILEAFYPPYIEGEGGEFGIGVFVRVELPSNDAAMSSKSLASKELKDEDIPIIGGFVEDMNFEQQGDRQFRKPEYFWDPLIESWVLETRFEFYLKDPGKYQVIIWIEEIEDEWPNWGEEPVVFAHWFPEGSDFPEQTFAFPPEAEFGWQEGEAIISLERVNHNFKVASALPGYSSFVVDLGIAEKSRTYTVSTANPDQLFDVMEWRLFDWSLGDTPEEAIVDENILDYFGSGGTNEDDFTIDFGASGLDLAEGTYWLEVHLFYPNGSAFQAFPIRVINQQFDLSAFDLKVFVEGAFEPPLGLDPDRSYGVLVRIHTEFSGGAYVDLPALPPVMPAADGLLAISVPGLNYNQSNPGDPAINLAEIIIDVNGDEEFGDGDFSLVVPLALASGEIDLVYWYWVGMFRPVFEIED